MVTGAGRRIEIETLRRATFVEQARENAARFASLTKSLSQPGAGYETRNVGCGWIVEREHAPALRSARGVDVVAVADLATERALLVGAMFGLKEHACFTKPSV